MPHIIVKKNEETIVTWIFGVEIEGVDYTVTVPKSYWEKLTQRRIEPEELVRRSFEFLLERESKGSILKKFDLPVIQKYFPEYEATITPLQK